MNFHVVNLHHKYQTFKSQTNGVKLTSNFKPFGGQAGNQRGCRPHFIQASQSNVCSL